MKCGILPALAALLAAAGLAPGAEIKVPGDAKTLSKALEKAKPGDVVRVAPGTYAEYVQVPSGVSLLGSGASKTRIRSPKEGGCPVSLASVRDAWVDGFAISAGAEFRGVDAFRSSFTLSNCVVEGNLEGVGLTGCFQGRVLFCDFKGNGTAVRAAKSHFTVLGCRIEAAPDAEAGIVAMDSGLYVERVSVRGARWGMVVSGESQMNCTPILRSAALFGCSEGGLRLESRTNPFVRNFAIVRTPKGIFLDGASARLSHAAVFDAKTPYARVNDDTGEEEAWKPEDAPGCLSADPLFEDPEKGDFRLKAGSPCAGAGVRRPTDPNDAKADVGCHPAPSDGIGASEDEPARAACKPDPSRVIVNSIAEEYFIVQNTPCECGGTYQPGRQALSQIGGRPHDVLTVKCACGKEREFRFDIGRFFGEDFLTGR
ncbi:MAG: hypothetical protein MUC63_09950 [Planctomycetes bacterium]|jgi:hypothetical protein|nr:hypothetical protein [Planctomycetota bacterium]